MCAWDLYVWALRAGGKIDMFSALGEIVTCALSYISVVCLKVKLTSH